MGYYVRGQGTIAIRKDKVNDAYKALCALNDHDDLKFGGRHGGEHDCRSPRPSGMSHHPGRWFSWMDANFPETCPDLLAVLSMVGFEIYESEPDGDTLLWDLSYDNKTGQEELFTKALAPFLVSGEIYWDGEDGTKWREVFTNGEYKVQNAVIIYGDDDIRPV